MKVVVVIPTYNERENIKKLVEVLFKKLRPRIKEHRLEVLVVDDSSPDATAQEVLGLCKKYKNLHLLLRKKKTGLGAAYLAGMNKAFNDFAAEAVITMDADFLHDPKYIQGFLKELKQGSDMVIGCRYIKGGSIPKDWAIHRKFLSVFGNKIITFVLGKSEVHDWTTGYRAIKKWVYQKVKKDIKEFRGYTFNVSFLYHSLNLGAKVSEVAIICKDRVSGKSKLGLEYLFYAPIFLFKTRLKELLRGIVKA